MLSSLDELRAFAAVYESGGFTAASGRLGLTTNAISLRVQKLEEELGVRLFIRTTRSVAATEEGRSFYARVSSILASLEEAEEELRPRASGLHGTVRLAIPGALATAPLFDGLTPGKAFQKLGEVYTIGRQRWRSRCPTRCPRPRQSAQAERR